MRRHVFPFCPWNLGARSFFQRIAPVVVVLSLVSCSGKLSSDEHLERARLFSRDNKVVLAVQEYKEVLQLNPQERDARWELGKLYLSLMDGASAEKELRWAAKLGIDANEIQPAIGRSQLLQRQFADVAALCETGKIVSLKENPFALAVCAEAWAETGSWLRARDAIRSALDINQDTDVILSAIRVSVALNNVPAAQEWARKALEKTSDSPDAWLLFADLSFAGRRYAEAESAYQKVIAIEQNVIATNRSARAHVGIALSLLSIGKLNEAIPLIDSLVKTNSRNSFFNYLRGLAAVKMSEYELALDFLQRAEKNSGGDTPVIALLGAVNYALGNCEQAEYYLSKYLDAVPEDVYARTVLNSVRSRLNGVKGKPGSGPGLPAIQADQNALRDLASALARAGDYRIGSSSYRRALMMGMGESSALIFPDEMNSNHYDGVPWIMPFVVGTQELTSNAVLAQLKSSNQASALTSAQLIKSQQPKRAYAHNLVGGVRLVLQDFKNARSEFESALALDSTFIPALINLGILEYAMNDVRRAREYLSRALEKDPNDLDAMVRIAWLEERDGRQASAIDWLEKARQRNSKAIQPRLLLGRFRLKMGQAEEAEFLGQEAVDISPLEPQALMLLGDAQLARQAFDRATVTYSSLCRVAPREVGSHLRLANVQLRDGNIESARTTLQRALELNAPDFSITESLVRLELQVGNASVALHYLEKYLRHFPKSEVAMELAGDVEMLLRNYVAADERYERASINNQSRALLEKRVVARSKTSRAVSALSLLDTWLSEHRADESMLQLRGNVLRSIGRFKEASEAYEQALETNEENVDLLRSLALTYLVLNDARALKAARRAYMQLPGHPIVADTLGWVLLMTGDSKRALSVLARAAEWAPQDRTIQTHYAIALERSGNLGGSKQILRSILSGKDKFEDRELAEKLLQRLL